MRAKVRRKPSGTMNVDELRSASLVPILFDHHSLAAYLIFFASYTVFAVGRFPGTHIDRPAAAVIGASMMFAFRVLGPEHGLRSIDYATIVLLVRHDGCGCGAASCGLLRMDHRHLHRA